VSGPQLLALVPSCEEAKAGDTGLRASETQASTVVRASSGTAIGTRMTPPRVDGQRKPQNAQFPGAGASRRVALPAGTKKVATAVASTVPSLRAIPTIPPFSKNVVPAGCTCGEQLGSSPM